jgi:hypothetical protein
MKATDERTIMTESPQERCDIKVWSGQCQQSDAGENKYLCKVCGTIQDLNHEMHHECFPYISGDTDNLS